MDIMDMYKSLNVSIETVMKNPETLKCVPDLFKTKTLCKHAVNIWDSTKVINSRALKSVTDCYITQEMCNKVVDNCPHTSEFVPGCYKTN